MIDFEAIRRGEFDQRLNDLCGPIYAELKKLNAMAETIQNTDNEGGSWSDDNFRWGVALILKGISENIGNTVDAVDDYLYDLRSGKEVLQKTLLRVGEKEEVSHD